MITGKETTKVILTYDEIGYLINCTQAYQTITKGQKLKDWMLETMKKLTEARKKIIKEPTS